MEIGNQILFLRKNMGITQEQLAQKLGITNQAVSKWEAGQCLPDIQLLPEIADFFNVSIDELMGIETRNSDNDILITVKNSILESEPGMKMAKIMKIVKALHAIVLVMESEKESSGYPKFELDETIDHAVQDEWGLSSVALPQIVATMRRGSVFFSDDHNIYDENSIKKISKLMKSLSDKLVLSVLFAIYDNTAADEDAYTSIDDICDKTDLSKEMVEAIVSGELSQYCERAESGSVRIKSMYMSIPPIISILYPAI